MADYKTLYDFADATLNTGIVGVPLLLLCAGALLLIYGFRLQKKYKKKQLPFVFWGLTNRSYVLSMGTVFVVVSAVVTVLVLYTQNKEFSDTRAIYKSSNYSVVEGCVRNFTPEYSNGRNPESFQIGETTFEYSSYDDTNYGYNKTARRGGMVEDNRRARVSFFAKGNKNFILKLEIGGDCEE